MYAHDDPKIIWVAMSSSDKEKGTFNAPFTSIAKAVSKAQPGCTVVLKSGVYHENVSIHTSGTMLQPIRIVPEDSAGSEVCCTGSWFFYDVSDLIIANVTFRETEHQAVSVIGMCERNNFRSLNFINCGIDKAAPCTFFFGGSGASCNVVEECTFTIDKNRVGLQSVDLPIALMISEGDTEQNAAPNTNHVFRRNRIENYGCAIVIGTQGVGGRQYSHIVENNIIQNCTGDGLRVKCSDTTIRGNVLQKCGKSGVSIIYGFTDRIFDNRIEDCSTGIHIGVYDCTVRNNCIVRSNHHAVHITSKTGNGSQCAGDTIIEQNTCINSGNAVESDNAVSTDIMLETDSFCIIQKNIFHGTSVPYHVKNNMNIAMRNDMVYAAENHMSGGCLPAKGCAESSIEFDNFLRDNFSNDSPYGASGWMAEGPFILYTPIEESSSDSEKSWVETYSGEKKECCAEITDTEKNEMNAKELYVRSLFANAEEMAQDIDEEISDESTYDDGIMDFSDWDFE